MVKKDPKKVAAGKLGAARRWATGNGEAWKRRQTSMHRLLDEDVEYLDSLGFPSRVEAAHAVIEFHRANSRGGAAEQ